jgi:hypothetical protein
MAITPTPEMNRGSTADPVTLFYQDNLGNYLAVNPAQPLPVTAIGGGPAPITPASFLVATNSPPLYPVAVVNTTTVIVAANSNRKTLSIVNAGLNMVFIAAGPVATLGGYPLAPGAFISFDAVDDGLAQLAYAGITATGTVVLAIAEGVI